MERVILHSDLNNFYASVECLYNPELRDKPVAVCGDPEQRHGIVLAKNYHAKKFGIQTGEAIWQARQKCPNLVLCPPHYDRYLEFSKLAKEIYSDFTPQIESFGLDECWLDVSGTEHLFGTGKEIADTIRKRIKTELGVTASVGVSYNKIFAKLGSDMKKPDATTVIASDNFKDIVWRLPVRDLLYVGKATEKTLNRYAIQTIGDLANSRIETLTVLFGKNGTRLWQFANGLDNSPVADLKDKPIIKSIGNSTTTPKDITNDEDMKVTMYVLCESVSARLREQGLKCNTVQITLRDSDLKSFDRQSKSTFPICTTQEIFDIAFQLYQDNKRHLPFRSIGIRACQLELDEDCQLSFFPEQIKAHKNEKIETAVDTIRSRFGHFIIQRGIMLTDKDLSNLNPKEDHIIHPVGFQS